jgi:hypothetical protein
MELNDIKKALYLQKPKAHLNYIRGGSAYYETYIEVDGGQDQILFEVPVDDMGDADYLPEMDAKLLIRYISKK